VPLQFIEVAPAKLTSFDPEGSLPHDDFDYRWNSEATCDKQPGQALGVCSNADFRKCYQAEDCTLAEQICIPGTKDDRNCYHEYEIPGVYQPAQLIAHPDGYIWFTNYFFGSELGRLNPETGRVDFFPLSPPASGIGHAWPWQVKVHPIRGDIVTVGFFSSKIARLPSNAYLNPACKQLVSDLSGVTCERTFPQEYGFFGYVDPSCYNPCIKEVLPDDAGPTGAPDHEPLRDLWFDFDDTGSTWLSRGYLRRSFGTYVFFPPMMGLIPSEFNCSEGRHDTLYALGAGIQVAPDGSIWSNDFCGKRIVRYQPVRSDM
jgi:hypothetical protein